MSQHRPEPTPGLTDYLSRINPPEHPVLQQIRRETSAHRLGKMAIAPEQAALLAWLVRLTGAVRCLEIGVFTGYSSTALALALPENGRLLCCDISVSHTDTARRHWQQAGVAHKISLHLQPALITLDGLIAQGESGSYDLAFIDADKPPTVHYHERCLQLVRPGGIIAIDNVLLGGRTARTATHNDHPALAAMQAFNSALPNDKRVCPITLPLGDGLTLLIKNPTPQP